ncbi:MAG TPA: sodium:solute symporter [Candidatus Acidoferrales bacterium]|nr:sodium:solute symporter [Candidatus Acidoferrales bacterium]
MAVNGVALSVFILVFALVTVLGFAAARWRAGDLTLLHEWGLGGRRFGSVITWFLIGGDFYTAYTVIAVPAVVFGSGAAGFFALPYTIIVYPIVFLVMPRLWNVANRHNYVTPADFVGGRYGSNLLALAVAITGILAVLPYIALQLVGMQVVIAAMGLSGSGIFADLPLVVAFAILAAYTYTSGLRAPAMIALVKDVMIYIFVIVAVVVVPMKLGGYAHIFTVAQAHFALVGKGGILLAPAGYWPYATLALGSAMAAFMYPHTVTGVLGASSSVVVRRNAAMLPAYTFLLGLIALLGYMAIAAGLHPASPNFAVPALFNALFPAWFAGFVFAAIAVGALVPAAIMSIAAANIWTRNIDKAYLRPHITPADEARTAKLVSLVVKLGALVFVLGIPTQYAINLQLLGGIWIIQTFPAIVFGLYNRWFHDRALLAGWLVGMVAGTAMSFGAGIKPTFPILGITAYIGLEAFVLNLIVAAVLTPLFDQMHLPRGADQTAPTDYEDAVQTAAR